MFTTTIILILLSLSIQALPGALGIDPKTSFLKAAGFGLLLVIGQVLFLILGLIVGDRFMHLLAEYKSIVLFIGFFLIGVRMIMDAFKVRKGERTFTIESIQQVLLVSVAQGINTFLAGLMLSVLDLDKQWLIITLLIFTLIVTSIGMFLKTGKLSLAASSLFFTLGGLIMIGSSIYLGFIL